MSAERGQDWGGIGSLPEDGIVISSDAELRAIVVEARRVGVDPPPVGLLGGDLCRTLGGRGDPVHLEDSGATRVTVDIGSVLLDGRLHWFCAHLVAGSWWRGRTWIAAIAAHHGSWNLAPRAHPGDGLLDVLDADIGFGDRMAARRRLPSGTHIPHPGITYRRTAADQVEFSNPTRIRLDVEDVGHATRLSVRVEADALRLVV